MHYGVTQVTAGKNHCSRLDDSLDDSIDSDPRYIKKTRVAIALFFIIIWLYKYIYL